MTHLPWASRAIQPTFPLPPQPKGLGCPHLSPSHVKARKQSFSFFEQVCCKGYKTKSAMCILGRLASRALGTPGRSSSSCVLFACRLHPGAAPLSLPCCLGWESQAGAVGQAVCCCKHSHHPGAHRWPFSLTQLSSKLGDGRRERGSDPGRQTEGEGGQAGRAVYLGRAPGRACVSDSKAALPLP